MVEQYVCKTISVCYRRALAQFRYGVAPIRVETGRYEGLPVHERTCFTCDTLVENELHVLVECPLYCDIREELITEACKINESFLTLSGNDKICILLSDPVLVTSCAKTCFRILKRRRNFIYVVVF